MRRVRLGRSTTSLSTTFAPVVCLEPLDGRHARGAFRYADRRVRFAAVPDAADALGHRRRSDPWYRENGAEGRHNGAFVQDAISLAGVSDDNQPTLWQDRVRLDAGFWQSLQDHPVPVREEAIQAIGSRSMAIDVYIWLAYRLHSLTRPTPITWTAIHAQFGAGFRLVRQIKPTFTEALNLALAVYPEAGVCVETEGIVLHPSPPAVPKAEARRLKII